MSSTNVESDNKRRKTSPPTDGLNLIVNFPEETWVNITRYLPQPSIAFLAVALSAPSASWRRCSEAGPSPLSKIILSSLPLSWAGKSWAIIDFDDVAEEIQEKVGPSPDHPNGCIMCHPSLAHNMTDDDLAAVLLCIDAKSVLKRLKLGGCETITGSGLEPLRGSTKIEQIVFAMGQNGMQ